MSWITNHDLLSWTLGNVNMTRIKEFLKTLEAFLQFEKNKNAVDIKLVKTGLNPYKQLFNQFFCMVWQICISKGKFKRWLHCYTISLLVYFQQEMTYLCAPRILYLSAWYEPYCGKSIRCLDTRSAEHIGKSPLTGNKSWEI